MSRFRLRIVLPAGIVALCLTRFSSADPLLIDDFNFPQSINPGGDHVYDSKSSSELFSGKRWLWGHDVPSVIDGGELRIGPGVDGIGAGIVNYAGAEAYLPVNTQYMSVDWTGYDEIELKVSAVTGTVTTQFNISSGYKTTSRTNWQRLIAYFNSPGTYRFKFSQFTQFTAQPMLRQDINNFGIATNVGPGQSITFDSLSIVPEPSCSSFAAMVALLLIRRRNYFRSAHQ